MLNKLYFYFFFILFFMFLTYPYKFRRIYLCFLLVVIEFVVVLVYFCVKVDNEFLTLATRSSWFAELAV